MKNLDKEEFRVKLEEINHLVEQKDYKGAMNVVDSIDWRRVKNVRTLCVVGEIYAANKRYEDSKEIFLLAYHRASIGKNILYRLVEVSLKLGQVSEAVEFYQEYREVAPNDNTQYILKYKILKVKKAPLAEQIKVLEDYKEKEFTEKWSYELAKLYYQDGDKEKCLELCNEIILWFNEGNYVMKAMDLKQRMGALTGEEKERYEQQFVPKLLKPEEADTIKEEEKAPETEKQGSESIESIQIKNEDLDGVESLQDKISKGLRDIFGSRKMDEMEDSIVSTEQTKEVQEEMLRDPASEKEYESVPELEPETGKVKVENTKETVAEESVNTADETAEKSAEAVSEENTEGLENADRSESAEEKNAFSTETETPVENLKMPTLNIPDSMKNMVPEEIEVPKAPVQNNLFSDEADAAEKMKDEKPAFDFSNFNLEDTILAAASAQGIEIPDEKVDEEKVQEENKEIVEAAQEISTKPQNAVKEEKAEDIPEEEEVITEDEEEIEPEPEQKKPVVELEEEEFLSEEDLQAAEDEFMNGPAGHKEKEEPSDDSMSEDEFIAKLLRESIGEEEDEDMPPAADDVVETEDAEEEPEDSEDENFDFDEDEEEEEWLESYNLLTYKPVIYAANVAEDELADDGASNPHVKAVKDYAVQQNSEVFVICAGIEEEISELDDDERKMFLEDLGLTESGLEKLVRASYRLLGLMSFLTSGEDETRAWTIKIGTKAPQAAGKIHTDFERGFIKAEVVNYQDLLDCGSYAGAREKGLVRMEGKEYVVQDGDVILFRFNV